MPLKMLRNTPVLPLLPSLEVSSRQLEVPHGLFLDVPQETWLDVALALR